jgi:hypothetical protein
MELSLGPDEAALVLRILGNYAADLRMEIGRTDQYEMRQALKREEALLRALLERLQLAASRQPAAA